MSGKEDAPAKSRLETAEEFVAVDAVERIKASPTPKLTAAVEILESAGVVDPDVTLALELLREHLKPRDRHDLRFISENKNEALFGCTNCPATIGFALPGLGEPAAGGDAGAREPHPDFMTWLPPCSNS